jgi:predicted DNA-binding protein (MmcQ/YjbR family)
MSMANYNPDHKAVLDDLLLANPLVRPGKMFGYPAYYAGNKLCICLYEQGVGLKISEKIATKLIETDPNVVPFQPLGRPKMREWIQINLEHSEDYRQYLSVFEESIQFVLALQANGKA